MTKAAVIRACCWLVVLLVCASPVLAQPGEWKDPSPHAVTSVMVDEGVQVEVLDWGGTGQPLVLLAGLGATAHAWDDLAPMLTPRYRVIGITRRGHRGSSAAPSGYEPARMATDIIRVMDAMRITAAVVIGHSFAGEEMHVLGARDASRIRGLVYVDAAFDRGDDTDSEAFGAVARTVPAAPGPTDADRASFATLRTYLDTYGGAGAEGFLRTRYRANADGTIAGLWSPDRPVLQAMSAAIAAWYKPYNPPRIRVPALAIYAVPRSADDFMRYGSSDRLAFPALAARAAGDPELRARVDRLYELTRARVTNHEKWFAAFAPQARSAELSGTHDLIASSPAELLARIEEFIQALR